MALLLIAGVMVVCVIALIAILVDNENGKKRSVKEDMARKTRVYNFLNNNFLTRNAFRRLVEQIASLSIYGLMEIRLLAIRYYIGSIGACVGLVALGVVLYRDVVVALLCVLFSLVVYRSLITKQVDNTHFAILKEFTIILGSIGETYTLLGNIPDAVNNCHKGRLLQKPLDKIYLILTSTDSEDRLEEFYRAVPFPMLQTLAGVCYLLNDAGDAVNDKGVSAFKSALSLLRQECDLEVRKLTSQRIMYQYLSILPVAPLPFLAVLETFFSSQMPGTAVVYNGMLGYCIRTIIVLLAIVSYWYIGNATSYTAIRQDDRSPLIDQMLRWKPFHVLAQDLVPKKRQVRAKVEEALKGALSNKDVMYVYASRVLASLAAFVLTLVSLVVFTAIAKEFAYTNVRTASFLGGGDMTVAEEQQWRELDEYYLAQPKEPRLADLQAAITGYFPDLSATDLNDHCNRIIQKYNNYHNLRLHWWYILIAYAAAIAGWYGPSVILNVRKRLVRAEEEEDVLQLQTMLAILRFTNLDTMKAIYWLGKQSRIYKAALMFAYHEYPSDPELALNRLRDKSSISEFQQICQRLLNTVSQVSIYDAFSDLEAERDQMLRLRETEQMAAIQRRRAKCSPWSKCPLMATVFGYVLVPIIILVYNEGVSILSQLGVVL